MGEGGEADITFRAVCLLTDSEEVGQALTGVLEWNPAAACVYCNYNKNLSRDLKGRGEKRSAEHARMTEKFQTARGASIRTRASARSSGWESRWRLR